MLRRMRSNFLKQLLAVVPNKQHFFFRKWSMDGNASKQVFTRFAKCMHIVGNLHRLPHMLEWRVT